jgi:hypothetical protein
MRAIQQNALSPPHAGLLAHDSVVWGTHAWSSSPFYTRSYSTRLGAAWLAAHSSWLQTSLKALMRCGAAGVAAPPALSHLMDARLITPALLLQAAREIECCRAPRCLPDLSRFANLQSLKVNCLDWDDA